MKEPADYTAGAVGLQGVTEITAQQSISQPQSGFCACCDSNPKRQRGRTLHKIRTSSRSGAPALADASGYFAQESISVCVSRRATLAGFRSEDISAKLSSNARGARRSDVRRFGGDAR